MKKFDVVRLKKQYIANNLDKDDYGIVLKVNIPKSLVLFFNKGIIGDYAVAEINNFDLNICEEKIPSKIKNELTERGKLEKLINSNRSKLIKQKFKENDFVRLTKDKEKYNKQGVFCGDIGIVAYDHSVMNEVLVDFTGVDANLEIVGDCISVEMNDLELIETD